MMEFYDAITHLKMLQKKSPKGNGAEVEVAFLIVKPSKLKGLRRKTTLRQGLANALEIKAFKRVMGLSCCYATF